MAIASSVPVGWKGLPSFVLAEAGVFVDERGRIATPYRTATGKLHNVRLVDPETGDRWWKFRGLSILPFGLDRLADAFDRRYRCLLFAEGESDALAAWAAFGHDGLDVLGVPGATTWRQEWAEFAEDYAAVYVAGDGDGAGERFSQTVKRDIPGAIVPEIPEGRDVRDVLQNDGAEAFALLLDQADAWNHFERAFFESRTLSELERRLRGQTGDAFSAPESRASSRGRGSTRLSPSRVVTGLQPARRAA